MTPLAALLALLVGLTLGLLGGGGSILTVPVFVYALGIEPKRAIAMSLPVVGGAALIGAWRHWRAGNVTLRTALPFGGAAMLGAYLGARLAAGIDGTVQLMLFAIVMIAAATAMARSAAKPESTTPRSAPAWPALLSIGAAVGAVTGLVGAGGGFLIVPALVLLGGLPMKAAVGTSLLVIAMNTSAAFIGYQGTVVIDWPLVLRIGGITAVGIIAGTALVPHVSQRALKGAFAALLFIIGTSILWQQLAA
ncbi:MAG: hypothetical protein RL625_1235 [Gemmatimonadota bacterium]|jgi:uncharacterized membrane protein YfcA